MNFIQQALQKAIDAYLDEEGKAKAINFYRAENGYIVFTEWAGEYWLFFLNEKAQPEGKFKIPMSLKENAMVMVSKITAIIRAWNI